ncbi:MAG: ABC transporter permease [Elusimicrobia bacterium]|nr:ABC transporter permease [Elusimicrobiota bacterium]
MRETVLLAWRNLWRNSRRSALTIGSVSCGLAAVMLGQSLMKTIQKQMVEKSTGIMLGHLQAQAKGVRDHRVPERVYPRPAAFEKSLREHPFVQAVSARIKFTGLVYSPQGSRGVLVVGVEPETEAKISIIPGYLKEGHYFGGGERDLVLGDRLAGELDVRIGEKLVVMAQAMGTEMSSELFRVAGIYHSGSESYDGQVVYVQLPAAQRVRGVPGKISYLVAKLPDPELVPSVIADLGSKAAAEGADLLSFRKIGLEVEAIIRFEDAILIVVLFIIFSIVGLGILNTVAMSMFERVREFGTLRALGARPVVVVRMIAVEALFLGSLGALAGLCLGGAIIFWWGTTGLHLPIGKALSYWLPFDAVVYLRPVWRMHVASAAGLVVVSLVSAAGPAFRAARLVIAEALRSL